MQVLIIGAGIAGLSAAAHLIQNGVKDILVLEARSSIGGRFLVQEHNGKRLHMGAQWVHGVCQDNSMFRLAEKYKLLSLDMERDGFGDMDHKSFDLEHIYMDGGNIVPEKFAKMAGVLYTKICYKLQTLYAQDKCPDDMTVEDFFQKEAAKEMLNLKDNLDQKEFAYVESTLYSCFHNILIGYAGDASTKTSAKMFGAAEELPGGDLILPTSILDAFEKEIPNMHDIIKLEHEVIKIQWSDSGVNIKVNDKQFDADYCICTLPAGVMKRYHKEYFDPALPESLSRAFSEISTGAVGKYFIEWSKSWRDNNNHPILFAWSKEESCMVNLPDEWTKGIFEISVEDPTGTLMLVWIVGDSARAADNLPDEKIKEDIGHLLRIFLARQDIPAPDFLYRNCWTRDKFAFGAYSAGSLAATRQTFEVTGKPLPSTLNPRLMFAGEATHPHFWSFLHGARDSGIREAERLLKIRNG